jgi:hypothetical protein
MTDRDREGTITRLFADRHTVFELIVGTVIIAFGVNLIASALHSWIGNGYSLLAGAVAISICAFVIIRWYFRRLSRSARFDGFVVFKKSNRSPVRVPEYPLAEHLRNYLRSAFIENPAFLKQWESATELWGSYSDTDSNLALKLLNEALEYFVLERLATHLTDYFATIDPNTAPVIRLGRTQVPAFLLENRFLALYSTPIEDRAAFQDFDGETPLLAVSRTSANDDDQEIHFALRGGLRFERFELTLPKNTEIERLRHGGLKLSTPYIDFSIYCFSDGGSASNPLEFGPYYLGFTEYLEDQAITVHLGFETSMKWRGWFARRGWIYYRWMESFAEKLHRDASSDAFFERIGWSALCTDLLVQNNLKNFDKEKAGRRLAETLKSSAPGKDSPVGEC